MRNDHVGDKAGPKGDNATRFSFLSINGVNLRFDAMALQDIFEAQRQMERDIAGMGESNVNTT
jgi:prophage maintenance system killer protein